MLTRYCTPPMAEIWSEATRYSRWLDVELAACEAMEAAGIVPAGTASAVRGKVVLDPERIIEIENVTRHDVIAFLTHVEEQAGDPARWLHLGLTSSDVLDTAFALQLRAAASMVQDSLRDLIAACRDRAELYRNVPIMGRTHGIHAEPTSLGLVFASWAAELDRDDERLTAAINRISFGKISGAVGNYANLEPAIERHALSLLGLEPEPVATQVIPRDRHAEFFCALGLIAGTAERIAVNLRLFQRTEVSELFEPFGKGQKGSSAMPHKRNPILAENITGLARTVRSYVSPALENMVLWHERDISHSSVERMIAPDATSLCEFLLYRLAKVIAGVEVDEVRIRANMEITQGLVFSEAVLLTLVRRGQPRQKAYEAVQRCAMAARSGQGAFFDLLARDPLIAEHIGSTELAELFDLKHHLRHVPAILGRVLDKERT
jgi:adenylosuccinate lyase